MFSIFKMKKQLWLEAGILDLLQKLHLIYRKLIKPYN